MRRCAWLLAALAPLAGAQGQAVADSSAQAFSHPVAGLDAAGLETFFEGRNLFQRAWIAGARHEGDSRGLGPLYNRLSCIACHPDNGRGQAPAGPDERMLSMLVRLSVPGRGAHGGPRPHPVYGEQLNEEGVPGVPGEGRARLRWVPVLHVGADGSRSQLRRPQLQFRELGYGALRPVLLSPRVGSVVYGLGLLQAVPDAALQALARTPRPDGIRGRLNRVWDPVTQRPAIGRFGWKANAASVQAQVLQAALGDLGLTSDVLPAANCMPAQTACRARARHEEVDLAPAEVQALAFYMSRLAPPAPRKAGDPAVERGRRLFEQANCSACHLPALPQPAGAEPAAAYTDLLLHDMGPGLADGRPDFRAGGRDWRTAPLWGIGLVPTVNGHSEYLHDGRARNLHEAVLWHDGEARQSRRRFERMTAADQGALLAFLASL
ncbi:thiol oxidoreductase [Rubrivivax gelatinosus]|uniref:Thiol oxidoreductase n=1 Tax=Rubrivivax gelatinosus TaxID=28068 RepID=A0ABS1DWC2_RUBGE|nr:thiol oxidoreductase [Rubrivivax gelatinosus]